MKLIVNAPSTASEMERIKELAEDVIESQGNNFTHPDADDVWVDREALHKLANAIGYEKANNNLKQEQKQENNDG